MSGRLTTAVMSTGSTGERIEGFFSRRPSAWLIKLGPEMVPLSSNDVLPIPYCVGGECGMSINASPRRVDDSPRREVFPGSG
jgi:hypothetical protein